MTERLVGFGINSTVNAAEAMIDSVIRVIVHSEKRFLLGLGNSGNSEGNSTTKDFVHSGRHGANNGARR